MILASVRNQLMANIPGRAHWTELTTASGSGRINGSRPWRDPWIAATIWLPVRVLLAPPRSPTLTEISRGLTNTRGFAGRRAGLQSLQGRRTASEAVRGLLSLAIQKPFPGAWEGAVRDSVRMRQRPVCGQDTSRRFVARDERASKLRVACGTASHRSCNRL